jgi:hypothetical protein
MTTSNEQAILDEVDTIFKVLRDLAAVGNNVWYEAASDYESKYQNYPDCFDKSLRRKYYEHAEEENGAAHFARMALQLATPPTRIEEIPKFVDFVIQRIETSLPLELGVSNTVAQANKLLKRLRVIAKSVQRSD